MTDNQPSPMFKASEVEITDEGLAFVCDSEAEAQRAYWEGQLRERKVKLDGNKLIMLKDKEPRGEIS